MYEENKVKMKNAGWAAQVVIWENLHPDNNTGKKWYKVKFILSPLLTM